MAKKQGKKQLREAIQWVADNYEQVVSVSAAGRTSYSWAKAKEPPPSDVAKSYMKFAGSNPTHFFSKTVPAFLGDEDDAVPDELVTEEKKSIQKIRAVLKQYAEKEKPAK